MAGDDPELAEVLHLAQTAGSRFTTVRATVRDWSHYRRIAEVQKLDCQPGLNLALFLPS